MLKTIISVLILTAVAASANKIVPRGVVSPILECGGVGQLLELRVPGCTTPPCQLEPSTEYVVETDMIPYNTCPLLGFKLFVIFNDEIHSVLDMPIPGSAVVGGGSYTVRYPLTADDTLRGETFVLLVNIYCQETEITELCMGCEASLS